MQHDSPSKSQVFPSWVERLIVERLLATSAGNDFEFPGQFPTGPSGGKEGGVVDGEKVVLCD